MAKHLINLAKDIEVRHRPTSPDSWASCRCCSQRSSGGSEQFPEWPCDARKLADLVLGAVGEYLA